MAAFKLFDRVKETSTTTGTGNLTLDGAVTKFSAFSARYVNNDTFYYAVVHRTLDEWEIGLGTYVSATPALARTTKLSSSNGDAAVSFSAGTKDVFVTSPAAWQFSAGGTTATAPGIRERLTGNRDYYVRSDGVNTNDGRAFTAGGAWLTLQYAWNQISKLDLNGYTATINTNAATFAGFTASSRPQYNGGRVKLFGDNGTPSNVPLSSAVIFDRQDDVYIEGFAPATSNYGIVARNWSKVFIDNMSFGACTTAHLYVHGHSALYVQDTYTITGNAARHIILENLARMETYSLCTLSGSPAFSTGFISMAACSIYEAIGGSYTGAFGASGYRYLVDGLSACNTAGGGASFFPGTTGGSVTNGGVYW